MASEDEAARHILGPSGWGPAPFVTFFMPRKRGERGEMERLCDLIRGALRELDQGREGGAWPVRARAAPDGYVVALRYPCAASARDLVRWLRSQWERGRRRPAPRRLVDAHNDSMTVMFALREYCKAALRRGLTLRVEEMSPGLWIMTMGVGADVRRLHCSTPDTTGAAAVAIGGNKISCRAFLERIGVPVAPGARASSRAEARDAAAGLGYPVVLKAPEGRDFSGVVLNINEPRRLDAAWRHVRRAQPSGPLLVERQIKGCYVRLALIAGKVAGIVTGEPQMARADGEKTCAEIVRAARPALDRRSRQRLAGVLLSQGLAWGDVPARGRLVEVSATTCNWRDVSPAALHPETIATCEKIAISLGLTHTTVELILESMSAPLVEGRGVVLECNVPGATFFHGNRAEIAERLVASLYEGARAPRCSAWAIVGFRDGRLREGLGRRLEQGGLTVGVVASPAARSRAAPACAALQDPRVDAVLVELTEEHVWEWGFPVDQFDSVFIGADASLELARCALACLSSEGALVAATRHEALTRGRARSITLPDAAPIDAWIDAGAATSRVHPK